MNAILIISGKRGSYDYTMWLEDAIQKYVLQKELEHIKVRTVALNEVVAISQRELSHFTMAIVDMGKTPEKDIELETISMLRFLKESGIYCIVVHRFDVTPSFVREILRARGINPRHAHDILDGRHSIESVVKDVMLQLSYAVVQKSK